MSHANSLGVKSPTSLFADPGFHEVWRLSPVAARFGEHCGGASAIDIAGGIHLFDNTRHIDEITPAYRSDHLLRLDLTASALSNVRGDTPQYRAKISRVRCFGRFGCFPLAPAISFLRRP
jgi:hypothetical protein